MSNLSTDLVKPDVNFKEKEIYLIDIWNAIKIGKATILVSAIVFGLLTFVWAYLTPDVYKSEVVLTPSNSEQSSLGSLANQFGGLASLAGINVGGNNVDSSRLALEVLKSGDFLFKFINKYELSVPLIAVKSWNLASNTLIIDQDIYNESEQEWVRKATLLRSSNPTIQELVRALNNRITISEDTNTGLIKISLEYYSPFLAQKWLELLILELNNEMRTRDLIEADKSIRYLDSQLKKTTYAEMRSVLYQLIEEQTKTKMFAQVRDEYVFKTIDSALVPDKKLKPKRLLIVILGIFSGITFGIIISLIAFIKRVEE